MKVIIKCPSCGEEIGVEVPKDSCVAVKKCDACGKEICTEEGGCCVICSYSDKKCHELHG